jgi:hypothetical protein
VGDAPHGQPRRVRVNAPPHYSEFGPDFVDGVEDDTGRPAFGDELMVGYPGVAQGSAPLVDLGATVLQAAVVQLLGDARRGGKREEVDGVNYDDLAACENGHSRRPRERSGGSRRSVYSGDDNRKRPRPVGCGGAFGYHGNGRGTVLGQLVGGAAQSQFAESANASSSQGDEIRLQTPAGV